MCDHSCNPEHNKWLLVLSNLSYLMPAGVTAYKMFKPTGRIMNRTDGSELIVLFLFIAFFSSWSYHSCRADVSFESGIDVCENKPDVNKLDQCAICPKNSISWVEDLPGSDGGVSLQIAKFIDHFLALFVLIMVMIHIIPIKEKLRKLIMVISMIWMILFLSANNDVFAGIPVIIATILVLLFWFTLRKQKSKSFYNRNVAWGLAIVCTILAAVFFKWDNEPYWIKHSLWHIMGALGAVFLISKTAGCYQDVDIADVDLPEWMKKIFITPGECSRFDN